MLHTGGSEVIDVLGGNAGLDEGGYVVQNGAGDSAGRAHGFEVAGGFDDDHRTGKDRSGKLQAPTSNIQRSSNNQAQKHEHR
jgi:hypothetical protein